MYIPGPLEIANNLTRSAKLRVGLGAAIGALGLSPTAQADAPLFQIGQPLQPSELASQDYTPTILVANKPPKHGVDIIRGDAVIPPPVRQLDTPGVPREVSQYLGEETVSIDALGCSAVTIEDKGKKIGVALVGHCFKYNLLTYPAGKMARLHSPMPLVVTGGNLYDRDGKGTRYIDEITTVRLQGRTQFNQDSAIGAFDGRSINHVAKVAERTFSYNPTSITKGSLLYTSGLPYAQPLTPKTRLRRQESQLQVLGTVTANPDDNRNETLLFTGIKPNKQHTTCSGGYSGAPVVASQPYSQPKLIGNLRTRVTTSSFSDNYQDTFRKDVIEKVLGSSITGYTSLCGIGHDRLDLATGAYNAKVVIDNKKPSPDENSTILDTPPAATPDSFDIEATKILTTTLTGAEFDTASAELQTTGPKYILNGIVRIPGGSLSQNDIYIRNPSIRFFTDSGHYVLRFCTTYGGNDCGAYVYDGFGNIDELQLYAESPAMHVSVSEVEGVPEHTASNGDSYGAYQDATSGIRYGEQLMTPPVTLGERSVIVPDGDRGVYVTPRILPNQIPNSAP